MLSFSTHNHFAKELNPERERKLLCISGGNGNGGQNVEGGAEREENGPEGPRREDETVSHMQHGVGAGINAGILAPQQIDAVLRQPSGIMALLDHGNDDLRKQVEERMRRENAEYYEGLDGQHHLPLHEIVLYLRDNEDAAEELRAAGVERLQSPEALLRFTNNLESDIRKMQDIEGALGEWNINGSMGIDIGRLRGTEQWLRDQCKERGLTIANPTIADWMSGRYAEFQPDKAKIQSVMQFLSGTENALPQDDEPGSSHLVKRFNTAKRWLRKRKLFGLFLNRGTTLASEDDMAARTLNEQIDHLQEQLVDMNTVLQEDIRQRATEVHGRLDTSIREQFSDVDNTNALERFGASQSLLGGQAIAGAMQPLERMMNGDLPPPESPDFARFAEDSYRTLEDYDESDVLGRELDTAKLDHQDTVAWATHLNESGHIDRALQTLQSGESRLVRQMPEGTPNLLQHFLNKLRRIATGQGTCDDFDEVEQEIAGKRGKQQLSLLFYSLSNASFRQRAEQADQQFEAMEVTNTAEERERMQRELGEVKARLASNPTLRNNIVFRVLHFEDGLQEHYTKFGLNLTAAQEHEAEAVGVQYIKTAQDTLQRLNEADRMLQEVTENIRFCETAQEFSKLGPGTTEGAAFYNRDTDPRVILVNREYIAQHGMNEEQCVNHEMGHAVVDIFTRRSGLFEGHLIHMSQLLDSSIPENQLPGENRTFRELLEKQAGKWKVDQIWPTLLKRAQDQIGNTPEAESLAREWYHDRLMDELTNRYATWVERGRPTDNADPEQIALFRHIEEIMEPEEVRQIDAQALKTADISEDKQALADGSFLTAEEIAAIRGETAEDTTDSGGDGPELLDINTKFIGLRSEIEKLSAFFNSYPEFKGQIEPIHRDYVEVFLEVQKRFQTGQTDAAGAEKAIDHMKNEIKPLIEEIKKIQLEKANVSAAGPGGRKGWRQLFRGMQFVSIMDCVKILKQGWEDMNRYWQRRGEGKQANLGYSVTKLIPKGTPYLGRMQNDFLRRDKESEQKEVNEWKEKLDEFDSYTLLDMLGQIRNKDQAKAIFMLLSERGRMDWNDDKVWETLNALSIYEMPIEACKRDDILRDKWIHKITSEIWDDKDLYFKWRQSNDGAVKSGKSEFTATVDQYSNVDDGLDAELINQLKLWDAKQDGHGASPDLNPHLYEEILDYSMRNGKMTMEGKLFFLVQGVAKGILSIDRLRTMAGETSGILNEYPWLDYFYKKNNSLPEVKALAKRLTEEKHPYKYGPKTTLWVHLEVMRVESTRQRISKAISGMRAENLDHEDIPTLVAQADYLNIDRMTGMVSGTREKLSPEAVRNSYTGFGTKFKVLGRLAQMEKDGVAQFTDKDTQEAAKAIVAYIHMDNIFTRNASKLDRPELTWDNIDTGTGPSTGDYTVGQYRTPQNEFAYDVVKASGFTFPPKTTDDGRTVPNELDDTFIRREDERDRVSIRDQYTVKEQEARYDDMKNNMSNLQSHLMSNAPLMKDMLIQFADRFLEENYCKGPGKPENQQYLNTKEVRDYFGARFAAAA